MYNNLLALLVKIEAPYGTDANPTGAANAILASDVKIMPMKGTDVSRTFDRPYFAASPTIAVGLHQTISFKIEVKGSGGAGTPPAQGLLYRACKYSETIVAATSVTYAPHSGAQVGVSIYFNVDGTQYKIIGAKGSFRTKVSAQGIVYDEFEMTGLFTQPSAVALPALTLGSQLTQIPQVANSANTPVFTVGGVSLSLADFSFDAGNKVKPRFLIRQESVEITGCSETIDITTDAVPLATYNPYALAAAGTPQAMVLTHGNGAGKICTQTYPAAQIQRPEGLEDDDGITQWKLKYVPLPTLGNDQSSRVFT